MGEEGIACTKARLLEGTWHIGRLKAELVVAEDRLQQRS